MLLRPPTIHGEALSPESHMSSQPGVAQPNKPKAKKKESSLSLKKDQV